MIYNFYLDLCNIATSFDYYIVKFCVQGGETNNIEEATIFSLFASGYETKVWILNLVFKIINKILGLDWCNNKSILYYQPALSVPIHVVELTNVPPELRSSANIANINNETRKALIRTPQKV